MHTFIFEGFRHWMNIFGSPLLQKSFSPEDGLELCLDNIMRWNGRCPAGDGLHFPARFTVRERKRCCQAESPTQPVYVLCRGALLGPKGESTYARGERTLEG